jgi:3-oxoadipate enol-lactonase
LAYAEIDGVKLYWEESGTGEPLLLVQGLGFSSAMWYRIIPALEQRFRVIRYDARGIGRSDVPPGPYTIDLAASDAVAILDAAGVERAHVLGVSLGGIVVQEIALTYPQRVASLMLGCTHPGGDGTTWPDDDVMNMIRSRTTASPEDAARASIPFAYAPTTPPDVIEEDIRRRLELPTTAEGYTNQLSGGLGYPGTRERLPKLSMPVLVFTGDLDRMVPPANSDLLAREIPSAKLVVIPGAGHVVFTDAPDAVTDVVISFVDDVTASSRKPG